MAPLETASDSLASRAVAAILQDAASSHPDSNAASLGEGAPSCGTNEKGAGVNSVQGSGEIPPANREESPASALGQTFLREGPRQFRALVRWAEENGYLFDAKKLGKRLDQAGEHSVYETAESPDRLYKITHSGTAGFTPRAIEMKSGNIYVVSDDATPLEYLERFILQNILFDDDVRFEGILEGAQPSLVISQPKYEGVNPENPHPSPKEIRGWLESPEQGFTQNYDGTWFDPEDGLVLFDTKPANWIKTREGIRPIDIYIRHATLAMITEWGH